MLTEKYRRRYKWRNRFHLWPEYHLTLAGITRAGRAGSGQVVSQANTNYFLHKAFPQIIDKEPVFKGLNYIYGTHPDHNFSLVSGGGTDSKAVAYGNNLADFSFIAGGVIPGVLILAPDNPENNEELPLFWGENDYVINLAAGYNFLVNVANGLLDGLNNTTTGKKIFLYQE